MKSVIRLSLVAAVCALVTASADSADARCCFLKKLFDRGGNCCSPCQPSCCEPAPSCGCGAVASDCGCGTVSGGGVIIEEHSTTEPTEASPADTQPAVPEPPALDEAADAGSDASA